MTNQLTLLFLVVVISGALCTVEDYVIMSQCAHNKAIYLAAEGTVSVTDISQTQNITIVGRPDFVNEQFKIALYAKETQRYLCFNDHWKLVGMKELQDTCYFNEEILHGYYVFTSVVDQRRRIGFTQRGRAVGPKKVVNDACYMFNKIPTDQFFHQHYHSTAAAAAEAKARTTTSRTPQSEEHGSGHFSGRGGRPNRHRNHQRNENSNGQHGKKSKLHSSGAGGGGGSGLGPRKRQHQQKQRLQQMRGGGGDSKNSTYLSSSRQQNVELGQYGAHNNHSGKHHNHSQPQYQHHHAARHHHSNSNNDSRRHHHYEQKSRAHHRMRTSPSTTTTTTTTTTMMSTTTTTTKATTPSTSTTTIASTSPLADIPLHGDHEALPTVSSSTTTTTAANHHDSLSTSMVHKRKGRRRKSHRKQHELHTKSKTKSHGVTLASYDDDGDATDEDQGETEFLTTDFSTWTQQQQDISSAKDFSEIPVKPTSASLPSWETWYPSASSATTTLDLESSAEYALSSVSSRDHNAKKLVSPATVASSPLPLNYDISKTSVPPPLPYPTTAFVATSLAMQDTNNLEEERQVTINTSKNAENSSSSSRQRLEDELNSKFKLHLAGAADSNATTTSSSRPSSTEESIASSEETLLQNTNTDEDEDEEEEDDVDDDVFSTMSTKLSDMPVTATNNLMTDYIYATRTVPKASRHRHPHNEEVMAARHPHNAMQHHKDKLAMQQKIRMENGLITTPKTTTTIATTSSSQASLGASPQTHLHGPQSLNTFSDLESASLPEITANTLSSTTTSLITAMPTLATSSSTSSTSTTTQNAPSQPSTTRKTLRKSTQRLLATPFHQLTYVRNEDGDIDIDSLDNISQYPDLEDNEHINGEHQPQQQHHRTTSRFTMISGYHHPSTLTSSSFSSSSATSALPESIRIAKIKINRERKRMLRLRNIGGYNA
ncbi:thisbe isoform X2 [Musca autumnalis]|uniref:thisbe isoform X2 n=1 Tax=Musca autumnalis TaxID=221902 RepID=UPI003CF351A7